MVARDVVRYVSRVRERLRHRVAGIVTKAVVTAINDSQKMQSVSVRLLAGEVNDEAEHFQPYGVSGIPLGVIEGVALAVGGDRDHVVVVAASSRDGRPTGGLPGEVRFYSDLGQAITFAIDGSVKVSTSDGALGTEMTLRPTLTPVGVPHPGGVGFELVQAGTTVLSSDPVSGQIVIGDSGSAEALARDGDDVTETTAFRTWIDAVTSAAMVAPFTSTTIGTVDGSSAAGLAE